MFILSPAAVFLLFFNWGLELWRDAGKLAYSQVRMEI
jgi:hypothetical protein